MLSIFTTLIIFLFSSAFSQIVPYKGIILIPGFEGPQENVILYLTEQLIRKHQISHSFLSLKSLSKNYPLSIIAQYSSDAFREQDYSKLKNHFHNSVARIMECSSKTLIIQGLRDLLPVYKDYPTEYLSSSFNPDLLPKIFDALSSHERFRYLDFADTEILHPSLVEKEIPSSNLLIFKGMHVTSQDFLKILKDLYTEDIKPLPVYIISSDPKKIVSLSLKLFPFDYEKVLSSSYAEVLSPYDLENSTDSENTCSHCHDTEYFIRNQKKEMIKRKPFLMFLLARYLENQTKHLKKIFPDPSRYHYFIYNGKDSIGSFQENLSNWLNQL
jgi:hypothetical protein